MTEAEWLACEDPVRMVDDLRGGLGERKGRLFGCACVRRLWGLLTDKRGQRAVEMAERYADGLANGQALAAACGAAHWAAQHAAGRAVPAVRAAGMTARELGLGRPPFLVHWLRDVLASASAAEEGPEAARRAHASLLRDVVGPPPSRALAVRQAWIVPAAVSLATAAYEERSLPSGHLDPARLSVLADALEEADCARDLLAHLRSEGPHVRGCRAIDLLLGSAKGFTLASPLGRGHNQPTARRRSPR